MIEFLMVVSAPSPVAPYSHATAVDGWVFVTGQLPIDPADNNSRSPEGIEAQTRSVMENLRRVLMGAGSGLDLVVFARVDLTRFERDYAAMNAVYQFYFAPTKLPVRTCVGVTALARGALVEIDLLARQAENRQPQTSWRRLSQRVDHIGFAREPDRLANRQKGAWLPAD